MARSTNIVVPLAGVVLLGAWMVNATSQQPVRDPAAEAVKAQPVPAERPEQQQTEHDKSDKFDWKKPAPLTPALKDQPNGGRITGFEFSRDPLGADKPFTTFDEVMKKESEAKPKVMDAQRKLLEVRYDLTPKPAPSVKMARGKPICVGPTARLANGMTWEKLGTMSADIRQAKAFPYASQGELRGVPPGAVLPRPPDARPALGAVP